jgi:hypothetical protein
VERSTVGGKFP